MRDAYIHFKPFLMFSSQLFTAIIIEYSLETILQDKLVKKKKKERKKERKKKRENNPSLLPNPQPHFLLKIYISGPRWQKIHSSSL